TPLHYRTAISRRFVGRLSADFGKCKSDQRAIHFPGFIGATDHELSVNAQSPSLMSISELQVPAVASTVSRYGVAARTLRNWIEAQSCAGYEPYDLLNSPYLQHSWTRSRFLAPLLIQAGRRLGGRRLRRWLSVPPSVNPKALALC